MKRDELKNLGLTDEQIDSVMTMHGADITREKGKADKWESDYNALKATADADAQKYATYDSDMEELATLRAYKEGVEFDQRFAAVLGDSNPVNDMTRKGLSRLFAEAVKDPANEGKTDADIWSGIVSGKEAEYFAGKHTVVMPPHSGKPNADENKAYQDKLYANNPFYRG
jgi:hypothetical protein